MKSIKSLSGIFLGGSMLLLVASIALCAAVTVNVYLPTTNLQSDFIASTTRQYQSVVTKSPYFANTHSISIIKRNTTSLSDAPIETATALQACHVLGFAGGMELERADAIQMMTGLQDEVYVKSACGGFTYNAEASTAEFDAFLQGCWRAYSVAKQAMFQRNMAIYMQD